LFANNEADLRSVILLLIESLRKAGSWTGETHLQKSAYFLEKVVKLPVVDDFILYKHGPFSFNLRDEIEFMKAEGLVGIEHVYGYGGRLFVTDGGKAYLHRHRVNECADRISFVAHHLGNKNVFELEKLGTALYVIECGTNADVAEMGRRVVEFKPHISREQAIDAINQARSIMTQWESERPSN
jgi:uncharacterized protein YwgA